MDESNEEKSPPENETLYRLALAEHALSLIASTDWPVNVAGTSPQKIARGVLS